MLRPPITSEDIRNHACEEFGELLNWFKFHDLSVIDAQKKGNPDVEKPGVYIYWKDNKVIKIGKKQ